MLYDPISPPLYYIEAYRCFSSAGQQSFFSLSYHSPLYSHIDYEPMPRICRACTFSFRALLLSLSSSSSSFQFFFTKKGKKEKRNQRCGGGGGGGTRKNNKHPKTDRNKKTAKSFVFFYSPSRESQTGRGFD